MSFDSSRNRVAKFSQEVLLSRNLCMKEEVKQLLSSVDGGAVVVEMFLYDEEISKKVNPAHIFYYVWLGKTTNLMDTIEIPPLNQASSTLSNLFEDNTIVSVRFHSTIPTAKDVSLVPNSSLDWDVVQNHAGFIENNLLRALSLITLDQELSISITPSIAANFRISKIEYLEDRLSANKTDDIERNRRRTKKEVARISNQTQLLIEPYVADRDNIENIQVSSNGMKITSNKGEKDPTVYKENNSKQSWMQNLDLQSVSEMVPLRVLPQRFRYCNTSFPSSRSPSSQAEHTNSTAVNIPTVNQKSSIQSLIQDDDYLNSFLNPSAHENSSDMIDLGNEENSSVFPWIHNDHYIRELVPPQTITSLRLNENIRKEKRTDIENGSRGSSNLCDAFIHPLYLKTLLELKTSRGSLTKEDFLAFLNEATYPFLAYITRTNASRPSLSSGIVEKSLVRVYCTEKVQPFMISLPSSVEKALGINEYDFVSLLLLLRHRPSSPLSINLHPISWSHNRKAMKADLTSTQLSSSHKKDMPEFSPHHATSISPDLLSTLSLNHIIDAFLRFIQQQSTSRSPFLFAHQSILTLSLPLTQSNGATSNVPSSNLFFSTPTKSTATPSKPNTPNVTLPSISTCNVDFLIEFVVYDQNKGKNEKNLSDNYEIPYLPVCYDDIYYEENIYKIISLLSLEKDFPVHGILANNNQQQIEKEITPSSNTPPLLTIGWEKLLNTILQEIYYQFSPQFLLQRWQQASCQVSNFIPPNFLIVGEEKTGKTSLLTILRQQIDHQMNQSLQIKIITISCSHLLFSPSLSSSSSSSSKNLKDVLIELDEIFERCLTSAPCLLLLDDLDVLCPASSSSIDVVRDERLVVLACYFERKLREVTQIIQTRRRRAKILYDSISSSPSSALYNDVAVMSEVLRSSIVIAATVKSLSSIDPSLLSAPGSSGSDVGFVKFFQLPVSIPTYKQAAVISKESNGTLSGLKETREEESGAGQSNVWKILCHYLAHSNIPLALETSAHPVVEKEMITEKLNKLKYGDFSAVLQCIKYEVSLRLFEQYSNNDPSVQPSSLPEPQLSICTTLNDVNLALERFLSIPSSLLSSATSFSTAPVNKERLQRSFEIIKSSTFFRPLHRQILSTIYYPTIYSPLYRHLPIRLPRAIMLYGLPGCGKTFLAQTIGHYYYGNTISQSSSSSFITIKGPQLLNKYIGESEKSIRQLFQTAKEQASSSQRGGGSNTGVVIFFDEFEALAPKRGKDNTGITDRIVNQLLTFIDGVESTMSSSSNPDEEEDEDQKTSSSIYILIATSRPDLIDGALLRPGRIEQHLYVGLPETSSQYEELLLTMLSPYLTPEEENQIIDELTLLKAAVKEICCEERMFSLTMADLQAMIDTAYLKAVHQKIAKKEQTVNGALDEGVKENEKIYITADVIKQAFCETKPSLHHSDRAFYEQVYAPFRSSSSAPGKGMNKHQKPQIRSINGNHENGKLSSQLNKVDNHSENGSNSMIDLQQKISFR